MIRAIPSDAAERAALIERVREMRNRMKSPKSLMVQSIKAFAQNCIKFVDLPADETPFTNLPDSVNQTFLQMIKDSLDTDTPLIPQEHLLKVLFLILNKNTTVVDCKKLETIANLKIGPNAFEHALRHCPKVKHLTIVDPDIEQAVQVPVLELKEAWANLKRLNLPEYKCNDRTMQLLQENFPAMEAMEFSLNLENNGFTMEGVHHMSQMQNLCSFKTRQKTFMENFPEILADVAGKVPKLRYLDFDVATKSSNAFVEHFGERYPDKIITIEKIYIAKNLKKVWPKNLKLKTLHLLGDIDSETIAYLGTIDCDFELLMSFIDYETIGILCETIGQHVLKLQFVTDFPVDFDAGTYEVGIRLKDQPKADVEKVLLRCPNLKEFIIKEKLFQFIVHHSPRLLKPENFTHIEKFQYPLENRLPTLFKLFLEGTEKIENLTTEGYEQLRILDEAICESPSRFRMMKNLTIKLNSMFNIEHIPPMENWNSLMDYAMGMAATIACNAPALEKIAVINTNLFPTRWREESDPHTAFIKEVDPSLFSFTRCTTMSMVFYEDEMIEVDELE